MNYENIELNGVKVKECFFNMGDIAIHGIQTACGLFNLRLVLENDSGKKAYQDFETLRIRHVYKTENLGAVGQFVETDESKEFAQSEQAKQIANEALELIKNYFRKLHIKSFQCGKTILIAKKMGFNIDF